MKPYMLLTLIVACVGASVMATPNDGFEVQTDFSRFRYQETVNDQFFMRDTADFVGLGLAYRYETQRHAVFTASASLMHGRPSYVSNGTGESDGDSVDNLITLQGTVGRHFKRSISGVTFEPFIGIGTRELQDDSSQAVTSTNAVGYLRRSHYDYVPAGLRLHGQIGSRIASTMVYQHDYFLGGIQRSYIFDRTQAPIENRQLHGHGNYFAWQLSTPLTKNTRFFITPYYQRWHIDPSNTTIVDIDYWTYMTFIEPNNVTDHYGLKMGIQF